MSSAISSLLSSKSVLEPSSRRSRGSVLLDYPLGDGVTQSTYPQIDDYGEGLEARRHHRVVRKILGRSRGTRDTREERGTGTPNARPKTREALRFLAPMILVLLK